MKKALVGSLVLSVIGIAAGAQTLDAAKVPVPVKNAFASQFPGLHPKWENENGKFEAGFKKDGKTMSALYAADGTLNETETDIKVAGLPAAVRSYVKEHYKGAPIKEAYSSACPVTISVCKLFYEPDLTLL